MCEKTMAIMIGIQGSGKSTFCQEHLSSFYRINLDTLKTRHQEQLAIDECFKCEKNFVVDNTNPTIEERKKYILQAKKEGYKIIGYFLESKIKDCVERNNQRVGKACIPAKAIAATSNKLQLPSYDEGFDKLYFVKNNGLDMVIEDWR